MKQFMFNARHAPDFTKAPDMFYKSFQIVQNRRLNLASSKIHVLRYDLKLNNFKQAHTNTIYNIFEKKIHCQIRNVRENFYVKTIEEFSSQVYIFRWNQAGKYLRK